MKEEERCANGKLYNPYKTNYPQYAECQAAIHEFNNELDFMKRLELIKKALGGVGDGTFVVPPFYADHGWEIYLGKNSFINTNAIFLDEAKVTIGDRVLIGPRFSAYTAVHPIDAEIRATALECAKPITIGNDVWIGGSVTVNPGVTIGSNVVIGSGSVVTKDIPDGVVAAGVPCKVIRKITEEDKKYWTEMYQDYLNDRTIL